MPEYLIQGSTLTAIADAVRSKTGKNGTISPTQMATEVMSITGGSQSGVPVAVGDYITKLYYTIGNTSPSNGTILTVEVEGYGTYNLSIDDNGTSLTLSGDYMSVNLAQTPLGAIDANSVIGIDIRSALEYEGYSCPYMYVTHIADDAVNHFTANLIDTASLPCPTIGDSIRIMFFNAAYSEVTALKKQYGNNLCSYIIHYDDGTETEPIPLVIESETVSEGEFYHFIPMPYGTLSIKDSPPTAINIKANIEAEGHAVRSVTMHNVTELGSKVLTALLAEEV